MLVEIPSKVTARVLGAYTGKLQRDAPLIFSILSFFFLFFPHLDSILLLLIFVHHILHSSVQIHPLRVVQEIPCMIKKHQKSFPSFPFFFFLNEHVLELIIC